MITPQDLRIHDTIRASHAHGFVVIGAVIQLAPDTIWIEMTALVHPSALPDDISSVYTGSRQVMFQLRADCWVDGAGDYFSIEKA